MNDQLNEQELRTRNVIEQDMKALKPSQKQFLVANRQRIVSKLLRTLDTELAPSGSHEAYTGLYTSIMDSFHRYELDCKKSLLNQGLPYDGDPVDQLKKSDSPIDYIRDVLR